MNDLAQIIVRSIAESYLSRTGVFSDINDLLEYQLPDGVKECSTEHARFYFFLIFNDHGTKSSALYKRFKELHSDNPDLFCPEKIISGAYNSPEKIISILGGLGLRYPKQASISWIRNAEAIVNNFGGEPINCFTHTDDALELFKTIRQFRGYGPKTAGLLLRVILGVGFNRSLTNVESVPLPVDIHDSRIAYVCHLYRPETAASLNDIYGNPKHISKIEGIWRAAAKAVNVEWEVIDRALWILGSRGCVNKACGVCPIRKHCDIGRLEVEKCPRFI